MPYVSQKQLVISGFETQFHQNLDPANRWVDLSGKIPWDELSNLYLKRQPIKSTGRPPLNPRIVIGALIIKHMCNLDDRETISQITENIYMQFFLGYSGFSREPPFDPSLFVEIRKRMGDELLAEMNLRILKLSKPKQDKKSDDDTGSSGITHKGNLLMDATATPQDIAFPTDLNLLNKGREITEQIIDSLHVVGKKKVRTYRQKAHKEYLKVAQNRNPSRKTIYKAIGKQLRFLRRNLKHIEVMLDSYSTFPLSTKQQKQYWVIQTLYDQQLEMYTNRVHKVDDRIVSIHQPHIRPIVRGKAKARVEFGAKLHASLVNGFVFLDKISWDAYNEGTELDKYVEYYKSRFGFYPEKVLVDKIYCTRKNRKWLKERGIKLAAKPLGRPSAKAVENHVRPGERNPIEGKFGQAKNGYGLNCIRARLRNTSESWIASIFMVLNLVKLAGMTPYWLMFERFSARLVSLLLNLYRADRYKYKWAEKTGLGHSPRPVWRISFA